MGGHCGCRGLLHAAVPSTRTLNVCVVQEAVVINLILRPQALGVHWSVQHKVIRIPFTGSTFCRQTPFSGNHHSWLTSTATARMVHKRIVIVQVRVDAVYRIDIVLVHALVQRVAEWDLGGLVAVIVEVNHVDEGREERVVQVVREVDETVAALGERERQQDECTARGQREAVGEQHKGVAIEGGLGRDRNYVADPRVRQKVHDQVEQCKDGRGRQQEDDATMSKDSQFAGL